MLLSTVISICWFCFRKHVLNYNGLLVVSRDNPRTAHNTIPRTQWVFSENTFGNIINHSKLQWHVHCILDTALQTCYQKAFQTLLAFSTSLASLFSPANVSGIWGCLFFVAIWYHGNWGGGDILGFLVSLIQKQLRVGSGRSLREIL